VPNALIDEVARPKGDVRPPDPGIDAGITLCEATEAGAAKEPRSFVPCVPLIGRLIHPAIPL
jgi:hypothetical protein